MREIDSRTVKDKVKELFLKANYEIGEDILNSIRKALDSERSDTGKYVLKTILDNYELSANEELAICQDTGLAILFIKLGQEVHIKGNWEEAINEGVKEAYIDGYLRKSAVTDPVFDRKNTKTNCPAVIYTNIVPDDRIDFQIGRASCRERV